MTNFGQPMHFRLLRAAGWIVTAISTLVSVSWAHGPEDVLPDLVGVWEGTLTYRDYQSDGRVTLPARLDNRMSAAGDALITEVAFTDPGVVIKSLQVTTLSADGKTMSMVTTSNRSFSEETLALDKWFEDSNGWRMVLLAEGMDDGRPARFRISRGLINGKFTSTKEVQYKDEPEGAWSFRNELMVERVGADPQSLVGTWKVDLRPTPDAEPYFQNFVVTKEGEVFDAEFYGTSAENVRVNSDWDHPTIAFTTGDGSGTYHTSARLVGGRLEGRTHALGRGFLAVWTAERVE